MVSIIKIWQSNWKSYTTKEATSLTYLCEDIRNKGFNAEIFADTEEEAMILRVTTDEGVFDIAPGFTMFIDGKEQVMAYKDDLSVYHSGEGHETAALLGGFIKAE